MKIAFKSWPDTRNIDLALIPENDVDAVLLGLLRDRKPRWYEGSHGDARVELIFEPLASRPEKQP